MQPETEPQTTPVKGPGTAGIAEPMRWLQLGVLALAIAGLFALLLVLSRTPGTEAFFPWLDFFRTALVVHVNQSVLIWFLAMAGVIWALAGEPRGVGTLPLGLALAGTLGLSASAFVGEGAPLMNNYVPVLQRPLFFAALGLFAAGVLLRLAVAFGPLARRGLAREPDLVATAGFTVALSCLVALASLLWSWLGMPAGLEPEIHYEYLFWGAGHALQFAFTQGMMLAWLMLAAATDAGSRVSDRALQAILLLGVLPLLAVPAIHALHPVFSVESRVAFTRLMQFGGGLGAIPLGLLVLYALFKSQPVKDAATRPLRNALGMSLLLFAAGGLIGGLIGGVNTVIPAHYHGSIVGVTLGLMGLAYLLLPRFGYPAVTGRLAAAQPLVYGAGQLLHVAGLAVSGALGIQRKTAGAAQGLDSLAAKASMGVMGIGGLLAVAGGVLFVWIMLRHFWRGPANSNLPAEG